MCATMETVQARAGYRLRSEAAEKRERERDLCELTITEKKKVMTRCIPRETDALNVTHFLLYLTVQLSRRDGSGPPDWIL